MNTNSYTTNAPMAFNKPYAVHADLNGAKVQSSNDRHHKGFSRITRIIAKAKAYFIARGIKDALSEIELIESGKKKPKSIDQLLNEL